MIEKLLQLLIIPQDKANHVVYGVFLFSFLHFVSLSFASSCVILIAIGKEVYDKYSGYKHSVDVKDALATVVGGLLGYISSL